MVAQPEESHQREIGLAMRRTGTRRLRDVLSSTNPGTLQTLRRGTAAKLLLANMNIVALSRLMRANTRQAAAAALPAGKSGRDRHR